MPVVLFDVGVPILLYTLHDLHRISLCCVVQDYCHLLGTLSPFHKCVSLCYVFLCALCLANCIRCRFVVR